MLNHWNLFLCFLFITFQICLADNDNLQDFCPTAFSTSNDRYDTVFINGFPCKNPANVSASDFTTSELKRAGDTDNFLQSSTNIVTAAELPGLNTLGLALGRTDMEVDGIVSPHSHPRSSEMMFVSKGVVIVGFFDTNNEVFQKVLKEGDVFVVPKAMLHFCLNSGYEPAIILSVHNSQNPGVIDISGTVFGSGADAMRNIKQGLASLTQKGVDSHASKARVSHQHTEL